MADRDDDSPRLPPDDLTVDYGVKALRTATDSKRLADFRRREDERREREMKERVAQARRDALAAFVAREESLMPNHWWVCPFCAALVSDREKHLDWHGALAATAAEASEAAWRGRPIG